MLAKKITYTDFDGEERTETFYFNLTKAELLEMQIKHPGGYGEYLQRIIDAKDQVEVMNSFKELIMLSYGEKSEDGKHFRKSEEISKDFVGSAAYDELFFELLTDPDSGAAFVNGIMPKLDLTQEQQMEINAKTKALIDGQRNVG